MVDLGVQIGEFDKIDCFIEKPQGDGNWINGGFFVCEPKVFDYIENDFTIFAGGKMAFCICSAYLILSVILLI